MRVLVRRVVTTTIDTAVGTAAAAAYALPGSDEQRARRIAPIILLRRVVDAPLRLLCHPR